MDKKVNEIVENDAASNISVIEEALLQNIVGGATAQGEIAALCCCECTGK
jgi:hypothetical protein